MRRLRFYECALALSLFGLVVATGGSERPPAAAGLEPPRLSLPSETAPPASVPIPVRQHLEAAALKQGLPASLVEAVAYWESGWDQSRVSITGAVGLMQVQPETEADVATRLVGRRVNLQDPADNSEIGAAILRSLIGDFGGDIGLGLAAYYQGEAAVRSDGLYPDTRQYVTGIEALAERFARGEAPPFAS